MANVSIDKRPLRRHRWFKVRECLLVRGAIARTLPLAAILLFSAPAFAQFSVTTTEFDEFREGVKSKLLPDVPSNMGGIDTELLPETTTYASMLTEPCKFAGVDHSRDRLEIVRGLPTILRDACIYAIAVSELQVRRDELLSGRYAELPTNWSDYTIKAGQFRESLFAPQSGRSLATDYVLLHVALRYSTLSLASMLATQNPDKRVPMYAQQLLRLSAAGSSTLQVLRIYRTSEYLRLKNAPRYLDAWQLLMQTAAAAAIAPYRSKIESLAEQLESTPNNPVRLQRLRLVYAGSALLASLDQASNPAEDIVRFVLGLPCDEPTTEHALEEYVVYSKRLSETPAQITNREKIDAYTCAAALRELSYLESKSEQPSSSMLRAIDSFESLKTMIRNSQTELSRILGGLELFMTDARQTPY